MKLTKNNFVPVRDHVDLKNKIWKLSKVNVEWVAWNKVWVEMSNQVFFQIRDQVWNHFLWDITYKLNETHKE